MRPKALRTGWTTGTCASAAAKAATTALRDQAAQRTVEVALPSGRRVSFDVESCVHDAAKATAVVVKDAGDDPDVTHGAHLTATVRWRTEPGIVLEGGEGVGIVTKPGLGIEVGEPAITATPRAMITQAVAEVTDLVNRGVLVLLSVPGGEKMARKTTNARLGILGGISILGTTGIVRPFSTASWRASVEQAVSVMAAQGERTVVLCTGGRTEKGAMALLPDLAEVCFVEVGDFTGAALRRALAVGLDGVIFVGMAGQAGQARGGRADDALHPVQGGPRAARRRDPRGGRYGGRGGRRSRPRTPAGTPTRSGSGRNCCGPPGTSCASGSGRCCCGPARAG